MCPLSLLGLFGFIFAVKSSLLSFRCGRDAQFLPRCNHTGEHVTGATLNFTVLFTEQVVCYSRLSGPIITAQLHSAVANGDVSNSGIYPFQVSFIFGLDLAGTYMYWLSCTAIHLPGKPPKELYAPNPPFMGQTSYFATLPIFNITGAPAATFRCEACQSWAGDAVWVHPSQAPSCVFQRSHLAS